jgi:hypothetical protein
MLSSPFPLAVYFWLVVNLTFASSERIVSRSEFSSPDEADGSNQFRQRIRGIHTGCLPCCMEKCRNMYDDVHGNHL